MFHIEHHSPEHWLAEATTSLVELIGPDQPFELLAPLDHRGLTAPAVYQARLKESVRHILQSGQTPEWHTMMPTGVWLELPTPETHFALKFMTDKEVAKGKEAAALLRCNQVFSPQADQRPCRLYGYGAAVALPTDKDRHGWIAEELMTPPYVELDKHLETRTALPLQEALALTVATAAVMAQLHASGIAHKDMEGPGTLSHTFWDPAHSGLRLIDFELAAITHGRTKLKKVDFFIDQIGIGKLLFHSLTGRATEDSRGQIDRLLAQAAPAEIATQIEDIIIHAISTLVPRGTPRRYEQNAAGTAQLHRELVELKEKVAD